MITLKLTKKQRLLLEPYNKKVNEAFVATCLTNVNKKIAILAQIYPDKRFIECHLLSNKECEKIKKITFNRVGEVTLK